MIDTKPPTSLKGIPEAEIRLSLKEKRKLALILSHSLPVFSIIASNLVIGADLIGCDLMG